jgi:hypothetical protein
MTRLNWSKSNARNLMARRGVESVRGDMPNGIPKSRAPFRRPPSRAEMRAQAAGAVSMQPTVVELKCRCGHRANVRLPQARTEYRFRCSECGATQLWSPAIGGAKCGDAS